MECGFALRVVSAVARYWAEAVDAERLSVTRRTMSDTSAIRRGCTGLLTSQVVGRPKVYSHSTYHDNDRVVCAEDRWRRPVARSTVPP